MLAARLIPTLVVGLGASLGMWCLWFVLHLPGLNLPLPIRGVAMLAALFAAVSLGARGFGLSPVAAGGAGLVSGAVNLMLLGSYLVRQPETGEDVAPGASGLAPSVLIVVPSFLLLGAVLGAVGGLLARSSGNRNVNWAATSAWLVVIATMPLLLIGGLVTSTESGMAVPDWPTSYGANMFLYPIGLMADHRIFLEHSHRLFGSLVGVCTIAMVVVVSLVTRGAPGPRLARTAAGGLLILVIIQGLMGGFRVSENHLALAAVHGIVAQVFFGLTAAFAAYLSSPTGISERRSGRAVSTGLVVALLIQLNLGAFARHLLPIDATGASHALWTHVGFSVIVVLLAMITGLRCLQPPTNRLLTRTGLTLLVLVALQFFLGWAALFLVLGAERGAPPTSDVMAHAAVVPLGEALVATAHQANGAVLVACAAVAFVRLRR